jgi:hypothetical protein
MTWEVFSGREYIIKRFDRSVPRTYGPYPLREVILMGGRYNESVLVCE